jgi:hypothetical protein
MKSESMLPRTVLAVVGLAFVVAAVWATAALAAGGPSAAPESPATGWSGDPSGPVFVQGTDEDGDGRSSEDCPGDDGSGSGGGTTPSDGSSQSGDSV